MYVKGGAPSTVLVSILAASLLAFFHALAALNASPVAAVSSAVVVISCAVAAALLLSISISIRCNTTVLLEQLTMLLPIILDNPFCILLNSGNNHVLQILYILQNRSINSDTTRAYSPSSSHRVFVLPVPSCCLMRCNA